MTQFSDLVGKTLLSVNVSDDNSEVRFITELGPSYLMFHSQDCCESVTLEDVTGDLADLLGSPITLAEESTSDTLPEGVPAPEYRDDAEQWTFYKLATIKGYVDLRWYGSSNGYYGVDVSFTELSL